MTAISLIFIVATMVNVVVPGVFAIWVHRFRKISADTPVPSYLTHSTVNRPSSSAA